MPIYLKTPYTNGSVTTPEYFGYVECSSMSFGAQHPASMEVGSRAEHALADTVFSEIVLTKEMESSTTELLDALSNHRQSEDVTITLTRQGSSKILEYAVYELKGVLLNSYSMQASGDGTTSETITLTYTEIDLVFIHGETDNTKGTKKNFHRKLK